jgi:hypothetical protein
MTTPMLPKSLQAEQFAAYPPQAKALAVANLAVLRQLPLSFLASLLRELIEYDYKFPAERGAIDRELKYLAAQTPEPLAKIFQGFAQVTLTENFEQLDWVNKPSQFLEQESAYLWSSHQMDAFRVAATQYGDALRVATPAAPLPMRRLGIAVIGQGVSTYQEPLFRNLRAHGTYFNKVKAEGGLEQILAVLQERAKTQPAPYAHWYVEGGAPAHAIPAVTSVSYDSLQPVRSRLLQFMQAQVSQPGMGPEELRTRLARLAPADLGMSADGDAVLDRFQVRLFTEGSGTQIFNTTFAQWTAREALRRAEPLTMLVRFAPRQRQRPMNEMLASAEGATELDPVGSLVDADMGAYYHWINQRRLAEAERSAFVVWFEGHAQALVVSPTLPRGTQSSSAMDLKGLLELATS